MKTTIMLLILLPSLAFAQEKTVPTLQSSGSCVKKHMADEVIIQANISVLEDSYEKSVEESSKAYKKVSDQLKQLKLEFNSNLNIQEEYSYENNTQKLKGIRTNMQLEVTATPSEVNQVLKILTNQKVKISGLNHQLSAQLKQNLVAECLILAAQEAKKQAQSLAKGLEVEVDRVIHSSFSTTGNNPPHFPVYRSMKTAESSISMENNSVEIRVEVSTTFSLK